MISDTMWKNMSADMSTRNNWAQELAKINDPRGLYEMAQNFRFGWGENIDYSRSLQLYDQAAQKGHAGAIYELIRFYLQGNTMMNIRKDLQKAKEYANLEIKETKAFDTSNYQQKSFCDQVKDLSKVINAVEKIESSKNSMGHLK